MSTFADAISNQEARTTNGMKARQSTADACVDLFFKVGASRGKNIIPLFIAALVENEDIAIRIALWLRDIRGGAGERELFRQILRYLEVNKPELAIKLLPKIPEVGRWDDMLVFKQKPLYEAVNVIIADIFKNAEKSRTETFDAKNLVIREAKDYVFEASTMAKWLPREKSAKSDIAKGIRKHLGLTPKEYRKLLVSYTNVVETKMCAKEWDTINFSHVPSLAMSRYKKAFNKNTNSFAEYVAALVKGDDPTVKVNAGAIYPYDVIKGVLYTRYNTNELTLICEQWKALPNYMGEASVLAMVDVSGSMSCPAGGKGTLSCLDVALSLGLYVSDKNTGKFKDMFLTFCGAPELVSLKGNIVQKVQQMHESHWAMNTDLVKAMQKILDVAKNGNVPQEEMPKILLILSDMQFDQCARFDDSAMQMIRRKYTDAGYVTPMIVFWNLNAHDNVPVKYNEKGAALVSGFSPAIMKAVLSCNMDEFSPYSIMLQTVMNDRYAI